MSSGACRALGAVLLTLVAAVTLAVPVTANSDQLQEQSLATYTVNPDQGTIDVTITLTLRNDGNKPVTLDEWGPVYLEDVAVPQFTPRSITRSDFTQLPGLWKSMQLNVPPVPANGGRQRVQITYTINAPINSNDARAARTPARVGQGYVYFCVPGQDTDSGTVRIILPSQFQTTQTGTQLEEFDRGLRSVDSSDPIGQFTCIEGTDQQQLAESRFVDSSGREIVLQAWPESSQWLVPAQTNVEAALDDLRVFLGRDIPGNEAVVIREAPPRSLGGYASAHDTPGIVQLDEAAGVDTANRNHEVAHAWFSTDNFTEHWLREGLASWTATTMAGATCAPVDGSDTSLDLSHWQVVAPTAPSNIEDIVVAQDAAACGIMTALAQRMGDEAWMNVIGSMLDGTAKYVGNGPAGLAPTATVDYREWLDAVDEIGLVPSGETDLDYAQNLLSAYHIAPDPVLLRQRSETRARYHQFLKDVAPMGPPQVVLQAMDNWFFDDANAALDRAYEVLDALREADSLLPEAGLVPFIQPAFEAAQTTQDLEDVRTQALTLRNSAAEIISPLTDLRQASPVDWGLPAAVRTAITQQRFDDVRAAIEPALQIVHEVVAANEALPQAGLLEKYRSRYESSSSVASLQDLAAAAADDRALAEQGGIALDALRNDAGNWTIPAVVTAPFDVGQIAEGLAIVEDARGVVAAAKQADVALPEASLSADIRPQFESVATADEMSALRSTAEKARDNARQVGTALNSLHALVPDWQTPAAVQDPIDKRDFASAALAATEAQKWIEAAYQADQDLPGVINAIERTRTGYEAATELSQLQEGASLAADWANAAKWVHNAVEVVGEPRSLMADLGLWGTDVTPLVDNAKKAAIEGDVADATAYSAQAIKTIHEAAGNGGLRLAGIVFFGVAVLGVLGLWLLFRRQSGPKWARQTTPHWLKDKDARRLSAQNKKDKDKDKKA